MELDIFSYRFLFQNFDFFYNSNIESLYNSLKLLPLFQIFHIPVNPLHL